MIFTYSWDSGFVILFAIDGVLTVNPSINTLIYKYNFHFSYSLPSWLASNPWLSVRDNEISRPWIHPNEIIAHGLSDFLCSRYLFRWFCQTVGNGARPYGLEYRHYPANTMSQKAITEVLKNAVNIDTIYPMGVVIWFVQNKNPDSLFSGERISEKRKLSSWQAAVVAALHWQPFIYLLTVIIFQDLHQTLITELNELIQPSVINILFLPHFQVEEEWCLQI